MDQSQDHVLRAIPSPLGVHGTCITLPSASTSLTRAFARVDVAKIKSANFARKSRSPNRAVYRSRGFVDDINS